MQIMWFSKILQLQVDWRIIEFGDVLVVSEDDYLKFGWVNLDSPGIFSVQIYRKIAEGVAQIVVEEPCHLGNGCVKNGVLWNTKLGRHVFLYGCLISRLWIGKK